MYPSTPPVHKVAMRDRANQNAHAGTQKNLVSLSQCLALAVDLVLYSPGMLLGFGSSRALPESRPEAMPC